MKFIKEYLILAAVIIGLSAYLYVRQTDQAATDAPKLSVVAPDDISKIEIKRPGLAAMALTRTDGKWRIAPGDYLVDKGKVDSILSAISDLTLTAMVSETKNYGRYDLGDANQIRVQAWAGDKVARDFAIGKAASSFRQTFVKLAGNPDVYHARGNFRNDFDQDVDALRDKTVLAFTSDEIDAISLTDGEINVRYVKAPPATDADKPADPSAPADPVWQDADGKSADQAAIKRLLSTLSNLRCQSFIDDRQKTDFTGPVFTAVLSGKAETNELSLFNSADDDTEKKGMAATSSQSPYPFMLPDYQVENIRKIIQPPLPAAPPTADAAQISLPPAPPVTTAD